MCISDQILKKRNKLQFKIDFKNMIILLSMNNQQCIINVVEYCNGNQIYPNNLKLSEQKIDI